MNHYPRICIQAVAFALIAGSAPLLAEASWYPPNMEKEIFDGENIRLEHKMDRPGVAAALVSVASDFNKEGHGVDFKLRAHALALAGRISPKHKKFTNALENLNERGKTIPDGKHTRDEAAETIYGRCIKNLMAAEANEDNRKCLAYVVDVALRLSNDNEYAGKMEALRDELTEAGFEADWTGLLGDPIPHWRLGEEPAFAMIEVPMPGGPAEGFQQIKEHAMHGLVVQELPGGALTGSVKRVSAIARKDENLENLIFTFDQSVGGKMGDSLHDAVEFLKGRNENRKEKVPSGYKIDLLFPDKFILKDGPSAGIVFALVLDTFFSCDELDQSFAATGMMRSDGYIYKIGGVAAKVIAAIDDDKIILIGIPEDNDTGVRDLLVRDGDYNRLLKNTQIFTMKNFDAAYELSRKEKNSKLGKAISAFEEIRDSVKKDPASLRTPEIRAKLKTIIDPEEGMPNHLSARLLLDYAREKAPDQLSAGGTWEQLFSLMNQLQNAAMDGDILSDRVQDDAKQVVSALEKIAAKIDTRFQDCHESIRTLATILKDGRMPKETREDFAARLEDAEREIQRELSKIKSDQDIQGALRK